MAGRRHVARTLKWTVAAIALIVAGMFAYSFHSWFGRCNGNLDVEGWYWCLYVSNGGAQFDAAPSPHNGDLLGQVRAHEIVVSDIDTFIAAPSHLFDFDFNRTPRWGIPRLRIRAPLWTFVLTIAIGAAWLWRRDAVIRLRMRAGHCRSCGYDRRSLAMDTVCPECGSKP